MQHTAYKDDLPETVQQHKQHQQQEKVHQLLKWQIQGWVLRLQSHPLLEPRMDCIEVLTEGGREAGDMVNLIILSMIHESLLFRFNSFFTFLAQPALKGPK